MKSHWLLFISKPIRNSVPVDAYSILESLVSKGRLLTENIVIRSNLPTPKILEVIQMGDRKSKRLKQLENEVSTLGYSLARQYVILNTGGYVEKSFSTLEEIDQWISREETRQLCNAGSDCG